MHPPGIPHQLPVVEGPLNHLEFIRYHGTRHPAALGEPEVLAYLTHLAAERRVSRSTQMQALSALMLLYRDVLAIPIGDLRRVLRSNAPPQLPAVLSRDEVRALLGRLSGTPRASSDCCFMERACGSWSA